MYEKYIEEIIYMMYISNFSYDEAIFGKRGREIGEEIFEMEGYKGLFKAMELLTDTLQSRGYYNYLGSLRELEWCWSGICEEFQA